MKHRILIDTNITLDYALKGRSILAQGNALGMMDNIDIAAL